MMYGANECEVDCMFQMGMFLGVSPSKNLAKPLLDYQVIPDSLEYAKSLS
jgi:hypothetical protein